MLKHKIITQSDTEVEFEVELDSAYIKPHYTHVLSHLKEGVKVAGFRPGKAPDNVVERELGAQKVQAEVMQDLIMHSFSETVTELKLDTVADPQINLQKFVPYSELSFRAKVALAPKLTLPDLTKLKVDHKSEEVTEADIDAGIEQVRQSTAERSLVKRPAKLGDEVRMDFEGTREGKPVEGAAAQNQPLTLGAGQFIPGFEQNLVGMSPDEEKDFDITFPADYRATDLAGKKVSFHIKLREVREVKLPEATDAWAKKISPFDSIKKLREDVRRHLQEGKDADNDRHFRNALLEAMLAKIDVKLPETLVESQLQTIRREMDEQFAQNGLDEAKYLETSKKSKADYDHELAQEAAKRVKLGFALRKIVGEQKFEVNPLELDMEIAALKQRYSDAQTQAEIDKPEFRDELANKIISEKAIEYIVKQNKGESNVKATK